MANLSDILTNYQSVDTLDSVTDRGATTTNAITIGNLTSTGNADIGGTLSADDTFTLNGATDATASIVGAANADATLKLLETGTGDVGARFTYDGGDNKLYIQTGNNPPVTRMTINRDDGTATFAGNVTTGGNLTVGSDGTVTGSEGGEIRIRTNDGTADQLYIDVAGSLNRVFTVQDNVQFRIGQLAGTGGTIGLYTAGQARATIDTSGNVQINDGNLVVANGHGISFAATSDASGMTNELLDDYEEGTWTVTASVGSISTVRSRLYTKIGRMVNIRIEFQVPSNTISSQAYFTGLPFNSSNLDTYRDVGVAATAGLSLVTYQLNNSSGFYIYSDSFGAISFAQLSGKTVVCNFTYIAV